MSHQMEPFIKKRIQFDIVSKLIIDLFRGQSH